MNILSESLKDYSNERAFSLPVVRSVDTSFGADLLNYGVNLSGTGAYSLLDTLGVNKVFSSNSLRLKVINSGEAEWYDEEDEVSNPQEMSFDERVLPKRLSWQEEFSANLLAGSPQELFSVLVVEIEKAFDRALLKKVIQEVAALDALSGYDSLDAPKAYTLNDFTDFEEAARGANDIAPYKWVFSPNIGKALRRTQVTTDGDTFIFDHKTNTVLGFPAFTSRYSSEGLIILGDFSKVIVKMPEQIDFLVDYLTQISKGKVIITATGMYDVFPSDAQGFIIGKNILGGS